jgi:hypothetical protein
MPNLRATTKVGFIYEVDVVNHGTCYSKGLDYFFYGDGRKYVYMPLYNCTYNEDYFKIHF